MSEKRWPKDPQAVLDYTIDWSDWLGTDTISESSWSTPVVVTGTDSPVTLVKASSAFTSTAAAVWLSGGKVGVVYSVTNTITTAGGRTDERTVEIVVEQR